ncbi:LPXTG cell wall anchor domain-containing protein [Streptococcus suis]
MTPETKPQPLPTNQKEQGSVPQTPVVPRAGKVAATPDLSSESKAQLPRTGQTQTISWSLFGLAGLFVIGFSFAKKKEMK